MVVGSLVMMVFSLAAVLVYLIGSLPTPELKREFAPSVRSAAFSIDKKKDAYTNYNTYFKKFKKMTKEEILKDNVSQAMTLFYLCEGKRRVIERMSWLMFLGLACFFVFVLVYAMHFLA